MGAHPEDAAGMLDEITLALDDADEPQAVIHAVVPGLRRSFPVDRATIRKVEGSMIEIVALWSDVPPKLGVGARMRAVATSLPTISKTGQPVVKQNVSPAAELLEQIIAKEGMASYVTLPIRAAGRIVALLSLSSRTRDAFSSADLPFLERVAGLVEAHVAAGLAG